jgi:calcium-dependent protein kinase
MKILRDIISGVGSVKTCTHLKTGIVFALKTLMKKGLVKEKLLLVKQEIRIMALLDHPNIIRLHEIFENKDCIYLILELCKGGELLDRLNNQRGHKYTEAIASKYVRTILAAVRFCHDLHICHRDLKLENFLFEHDGDHSDFKVDFFCASFYYIFFLNLILLNQFSKKVDRFWIISTF